MAKNSPASGIISWTIAIAVIALIGLVMLILFGNLSGNVGFAVDSQGYNDTQSVIGNYSSSVTNTTAQLPVVGTIIGVALLLLILIGVLVFAVRKLSGLGGSTGGSSDGSFG